MSNAMDLQHNVYPSHPEDNYNSTDFKIFESAESDTNRKNSRESPHAV